MRALLRRLGVYVLAAWVAITVSFLLPRVVPGNPVAGAVARASQSGNCNSQCVIAVEEQLGYNVHTSVWEQYLSYIGNLAHGDLGHSWSENAPVGSLILSYLPWTLGLLVVATTVIWYAARNALLPVVSNFTIAISLVVAGQILVEIVFNYPGIGFHLFDALGKLDYSLVQGIFVVITLVVLAANLLADVVYVMIDPRARQAA